MILCYLSIELHFVCCFDSIICVILPSNHMSAIIIISVMSFQLSFIPHRSLKDVFVMFSDNTFDLQAENFKHIPPTI
jgi:hypothetical protein